MNNFAVLDISYTLIDDTVRIIVTTNNPCHLTIYYTDKEPVRHRTSRNQRGLTLPWGAYYCFVSWLSFEQLEPGDTLVHTFEIPGWLMGQIKWFAFRGTVAGQISPSVSPVFKYQRTLGSAVIPANGSEGFCIVAPRVATWELAHGATSGIVTTTNYVSAVTSYSAFLIVGYDCARGFLYFDTSSLSGKTIVTATISLFVTGKEEYNPGHGDLHVVEGIQDDPLVDEAFGQHLLYVLSVGSIVHADIVENAWNEITLDAYGIQLLNLEGTSKFCLKLSGDINDTAPSGPSTGNRVEIRSTHTPGYAPKLLITYKEGD